MAVEIYRNASLIQHDTYQTDPSRADQAVQKLRERWASLREKGYAGDYPVHIFRQGGVGDKTATVVQYFRWNSEQARVTAAADPDVRKWDSEIADLAAGEPARAQMTEAIRGFNRNFPTAGGVELLRGVCSCLLTVDGVVENFPMSVKNGIVLMHRSPRMDQDGDGRNEMYLKILMHGGELMTPALGPIRVDQNFTRPNDGIVKSKGEGNDFPGNAIWRVAWKIHTPMGAVLTDPETPLVFGPATVNHYPPVGTRFLSPTGPVALIHEETGKRVGTLTPRELTAFDIVITKDDEVFADMLNKAPEAIFDLLREQLAKTEGQELGGLEDTSAVSPN
jgi:hypothetical protein